MHLHVGELGDVCMALRHLLDHYLHGGVSTT